MSFYRMMFALLLMVVALNSVFANEAVVVHKNNASAQSVVHSNPVMVKTNLNTATAKELAKVSGLNAAKARSIVSYRTKHGEFKSLDELIKVRAIKKLTTDEVKAIQEQLSIS